MRGSRHLLDDLRIERQEDKPKAGKVRSFLEQFMDLDAARVAFFYMAGLLTYVMVALFITILMGALHPFLGIASAGLFLAGGAAILWGIMER